MGVIDRVSVMHKAKGERSGRRWVYDQATEERVLAEVLRLDQRDHVNTEHDAYQLYIVLAETGMQHIEVLNLTWADIDFGRRMPKLWCIEDLKNESSARSIPLTQRCINALQSPACKEGKRGPFDGMHIRRSQELHKLARHHAGVNHKDSVPHSLRHTAGTPVLAATGDLRLTQQWLGHADIKSTERYAKVVDARMRQAAGMLDKLSPELR